MPKRVPVKQIVPTPGIRMSALMLNSDAIDNGEWILARNFPGLRFKLRSPRYQPYADAQTEALKLASSKLAAGAELDQAIMAEITRINVAALLLLDWDGLLDDDGNPYPFSLERAREMILDPDAILFREAVYAAAGQVGMKRREAA
jgi:hypothetical protein